MAKNEINDIYYVAKLDSIYKYVSLERGIEFFKKKALNFNSPLEFNDPFDCNPSLIELDNKYVIELLKEIKFLDAHVLDNYENDPLLSTFINLTKHKTVWNAASETLKNVKITCFSEKKHNLLMWSHYSRNHTGLCLEFDTKKLISWTAKFLPKSPVFLKVNYNILRENIMHSGKFDNNELFTWLKTKSKDWEYEEEIRLVWLETEKGVDRRLPTDILKHVYIGNRMKENEQNQIVELCKKSFSNALISKAYLSSTKFCIEEKRLL